MRLSLRRKPFFALIVGVLLIFVCSSWGYLVHRTVAQLAIYELPSSMRSFFWKNKDSIVSQSTRPDVRRNSDKSEAPRHFIDIENYGDSAAWKMPLTKAEALRIYPFDTLFKYGYLPYVVQDELERLTEAMRKGDKDSILFYAVDLCHYIGDANVPLHTSNNFDGQLTGQKGIHALWESTVPDQLMNGYKLRDGHKAQYVADPAAAVWESIRRAHQLVQPMLDAEKEASQGVPDSVKYQTVHRYGRDMKVYTAAFGKIYGGHLGTMVRDQLQHSSDQIADFWYTAWINAGKPDLDNLLSTPLTKKDKKDLRTEEKAYRKNRLIEKGLLLSRHYPGWE